MKTAGQVDGKVLFTASQFAPCPALNEPPAKWYKNAAKGKEDASSVNAEHSCPQTELRIVRLQHSVALGFNAFSHTSYSYEV